MKFILDEEGNVKVIYLLVYVDDLIMAATDLPLLLDLIAYIQGQVHNLKVVENPNKFLGVEFTWLEDGSLKLSQRGLVNTILAPAGLVRSVSHGRRDTPMEVNWDSKRSSLVENRLLDYSIRDVVGQLRFLADRTRWDIKVAVGKISQYQNAPTEFEELSIGHIYQYLQKYPDLGITLRKGDGKIKIFCSSDASHLSDADCKPRIGIEIHLHEKAASVIAISRKAIHVGVSSFHSELNAASEAVHQCKWMRGLLQEFKLDEYFGCDLTVKYENDSKGLIDCLNGEHINAASKHLAAKIEEAREFRIGQGIEFEAVPGVTLRTDTLTKPLVKRPYWLHNIRLMDLRDEECIQWFFEEGGMLADQEAAELLL